MAKLIFFILLLIVSAPGISGSISKSFEVAARIDAGCTIQSAATGVIGTLNFGSYPGTSRAAPSGSLVQSTGFTLICTPGVTLTMSVDSGSHYTTVRNLMQSGNSQLIPYQLYTSSNFAAGSEILVNQSISLGSSTGNNITLPIYGKAQLNGFSASGTYTDTLTVTLSW